MITGDVVALRGSPDHFMTVITVTDQIVQVAFFEPVESTFGFSSGKRMVIRTFPDAALVIVQAATCPA